MADQASSTNSEMNQQVQYIVDFIQNTWPDITIDPNRVSGWAAEINSGEGRSLSELRSDIFEFVVGDDKVQAWVKDAFESRGMTVETADEAEADRLQRIAQQLATGERTFDELGKTLDSLKSPGDNNTSDGVDVTEGPPPEENKVQAGVGGGTDTTVSILTSKDMKWYFDLSSGKWYVSYKLPNSNRNMFFEATGSQLDAIFGDGMRPAGYEQLEENGFATLGARDGFTFGGDVAEVEGTGSFEGEVDKVIARALDEGTLPSWASKDGAVFDLLYVAASEGKSQDWLIEELSKLSSFKQRFPNIDSLKNVGLTTTEAVTGFLELESGIKQLTVRDGGDPSAVTPARIGDMLAKGHSLADAEFTFQIFDTMEKNAGALEAFNEVLVARGQQPLSDDEMYDFMAGNAPKELYDIWEEASLNRAAADAGLNLGVDAAIELAKKTEGLTSYGSAMEGLTEAAKNILQFRSELALDQFGLNQEDLVDLSLGLPPSSGQSQADIAQNMQKAFLSAKATRERARINPFKRFTNEGVPQSASLSKVRQQS